MSFIYRYEKQLFDKEWEIKKSAMLESGMSDEDIGKMYEFDWNWFNSICRYKTNTEALDTYEIADGSDKQFDEGFDFIEQIEDIRFIHALRSLNETEYQTLMKIVIDGLKQSDIARASQLSRNSIYYRMKSIRKKFANYL